MNAPDEGRMRSRARRAYELSRAGNAVALGAIVALPTMTASMNCCSTPGASVLCGVGLGGTIAAARFVGMRSERAIRAGLLAGLLAFSFPLTCHLFVCPTGMCVQGGMAWLPYVAVGAAFLGGIVMRLASRGGSALVAGSTALFFGSLGSLAIGLEGPLLTAAGLAAGSVLPLRNLGR